MIECASCNVQAQLKFYDSHTQLIQSASISRIYIDADGIR